MLTRNPVTCPLPGDVWMVPDGTFKVLAVVFRVDSEAVEMRVAGDVKRVPVRGFREFLSGAERMPVRLAA